MPENWNTLIQLVTSASTHRTNVSISPKVTINDKSWNGELTCKTEPLLQFTHLTARCQQRPFEKDVTYSCVCSLIVCWSSQFVAVLTQLMETTNSELTCLFQLSVNNLVTSDHSCFSAGKEATAPLPACFSSVHRFRFSGRPEGSSSPSSDGRTTWELDLTLLNSWWLCYVPGPLCCPSE